MIAIYIKLTVKFCYCRSLLTIFRKLVIGLLLSRHITTILYDGNTHFINNELDVCIEDETKSSHQVLSTQNSHPIINMP